MGGSSGTGNTAPGLTSAAILLLIWSLLTYLVRVWVKLRKNDNWGVDDSIISAALFVAVLHVIATCYAINHGYGNEWSSISATGRLAVQKALYASQIFYVVSIGMTRMSTSLFSARLTRDKRNARLAPALTVACGLWTTASVLVVAIRGDLTQPWKVLNGSKPMFVRWLGIELSGMLVELSTWSASIWLIWGLHMPLRKRLSVVGIFSCRLFVFPVIATRLWYLTPSENNNAGQPRIVAEVSTEAVLEFVLMLASIICLKPFLRPFHAGYFVGTADGKGSGYRTGGSKGRGDAYYVLSAATTNNESKSAVALVSQSRLEDMSPANTSGKVTKQQGKIPTNLSPSGPLHRSTVSASERSEGSVGSEQMIISKTQAWTVTYEEEQQRNTLRS